MSKVSTVSSLSWWWIILFYPSSRLVNSIVTWMGKCISTFLISATVELRYLPRSRASKCHNVKKMSAPSWKTTPKFTASVGKYLHQATAMQLTLNLPASARCGIRQHRTPTTKNYKFKLFSHRTDTTSMGDLGEGPGEQGPPLFWVTKKKRQKGEKPTGQVDKNRPQPLS